MVEIKWDRDTCVRCSMVICDRRFAAQVRGGPKDMAFKFDDIGCVMFWLATTSRITRGSTIRPPEMLGRRCDQQGQGKCIWLDARKAHYVTRQDLRRWATTSAPSRYPQLGSIDFESMARTVLAKGK